MEGIFFNGRSAEYRLDLPTPMMQEGESLIEIHLAGVCNTDKEIRKG